MLWDGYPPTDLLLTYLFHNLFFFFDTMNSGDVAQVTINTTAARGVKFLDTDAPGASQVKVLSYICFC